ncbi:MAG: NACHT domain-containing protein, partial [Magnetospirillum sp.]|nr:NACHT domain-containing protein [Magnetospirillum sp.]
MSAFYFPLTLGRPRSAPRDDERRRPPELQAWREGVRPVRPEVERIAGDRIYRDLLRPAGPGYTLVTGEPGSGKSTLLEQWRQQWAKDAPSPRLGLVVPVLVRFRSLNHCAANLLATGSEEDLALALWAEHLRPDAATPALTDFYRRNPRLWTPLWLLDGLDEAAEHLRAEAFLRRLAHLPGRVCLSCRTAIAQALRPALQPGLGAGGSLEIQPLNACEQRDFLAQSLGDKTRAATLHRRIASNTQMRELAGNPLLLDLIALVGEEVDLPASRAAFYERAVAKLWTKVEPTERARSLRAGRDATLTALAEAVGLAEIEFHLDAVDSALGSHPAGLRDAMVTAGLLRIDDERVRAGFLHLTFQEYYLARALAGRPFAEVLREHWSSPRHEETLALLLAMVAARDAVAADAALLGLVEWGLKTHRNTPETLWKLGRSPLRVVLHLVMRSGIGLKRFPGLHTAVTAALEREHRLCFAMAADAATPPDILAKLAEDHSGYVRSSVVQNPTTPPDILIKLAEDPNFGVRKSVAGNPATPPDVLVKLAEDQEKWVRGGVAKNLATPPDILAKLAEDREEEVRNSVAENPATPPDILAKLA